MPPCSRFVIGTSSSSTRAPSSSSRSCSTPRRSIWVGAGHEVQGRAGLLAMFRQGQEYYAGQSRLTVVAGTADQAIWWEPTEAGLAPRGLQVLRAADGLIREIADAHDAALVARALEEPSPA